MCVSWEKLFFHPDWNTEPAPVERPSENSPSHAYPESVRRSAEPAAQRARMTNPSPLAGPSPRLSGASGLTCSRRLPTQTCWCVE